MEVAVNMDLWKYRWLKFAGLSWPRGRSFADAIVVPPRSLRNASPPDDTASARRLPYREEFGRLVEQT
jgi:hypothetical protein